MAAADMDILQGGLNGAMAQQELNRVGIDARVKPMGGKGVAARIVTLLIHRQYFRSVTPTIPSLDRQLSWSEGYAISPRTASSLNSPMA